jgi:hypothetical protein
MADMLAMLPTTQAGALDPYARQLLINQGRLGAIDVKGKRTQEQEVAAQMGQAQGRTQDQLSLINQFYADPARQTEIDRTVQSGLDQSMIGLEDQIREAARQQAIQRARSGNVGGSFQAQQQAGLQAAMDSGTAQIAATGEAQQDMLRQALLQQQFNEQSGAMGIDPYTAQSIQERMRGLGVADQGNAAMMALQNQRAQQEAYANDELSRGFGNLLNLGGQAFTLDQRAKMLGRTGLFRS